MYKRGILCFIQAFILMIVLIGGLTSKGYAQDGVFYVDYENGADSGDGLTPATAWKHCPGDPEATGNPAGYTPLAGDVFLFKGGVVYRGRINVSASGNTGAPITYKGNGWGTDPAVIDGSEIIPSTWTQCTSPAQCGNNPNWSSIWWTDTPMIPTIDGGDDYAYAANLHQGNDFLYVAQWPSPVDSFYYDNIETYAHATLGNTSLTHPELESLGGSQLIGATALIHNGNNTVGHFRILGYSNNTITYETVTNLGNGYDEFALSNYEGFIDAQGEYVYRDNPDVNGNHRIFLWPKNNQNPNDNISLSVRENAIHISSANNIVVEGFKVARVSGNGTTHQGVAIRAVNGGQNIVIRNNVIEHCRFGNYGGYGGIYLRDIDGALVEENLVQWNPRHRGIFCSVCNRATVSKNVVTRSGLTAIGMYTCTYGQVIDNVVDDCRGGHGNGLTFYMYNDKILIARNFVRDANICVTVEKSKNLTFYSNFFDGDENTDKVMINRGQDGTGEKFLFLNNTIVNSKKSFALCLQLNPYAVDLAIRNNIIDGLSLKDTDEAPGSHTYNLYNGVAWDQNSDHNWAPDTGEIINPSTVPGRYHPIPGNTVFVDPSVGGDYSLLSNSPARNAGTDISSLLPTADFPDFDFNVDINGNPRVSGGAWDMGAYEYVEGTPPTPTPTPMPINVAYQKAVTVDSTYSTYVASNAVDGVVSDASRWVSANASGPHWAEINFGGSYTIDSWELYSGFGTVNAVSNFVLQYWDGSAWNDIPETAVTGNMQVIVSQSFSPVTTNKVRFYSTNNGYVRVKEINVYQ